MIVSLMILTVITCGGAALTYSFADNEPLLWRLSAGSIIGSAIFGLIGFLLACLIGLSVSTVLAAALVSAIPLLLLRNKRVKQRFLYDKQKAKSQFQGAGFRKFYRFLYYLILLIILGLFFDHAMITNNGGIFTGASQNLGDLPFHLGTIFSFTDGQNFPPQNPSFADAKFTYPFIADFITACFVKVGNSAQHAFFIQNLTLGFSLVVLLERFVFKLTNNKMAGKIAPLLLLFSGGLGFLWFGKDLWEGGKGFFDLLWNLPRDYTIGDRFRWGNSLVTLFVTQRSLLLGMPLTILALTHLWKIFAGEETKTSERIANPKSQIPNLTVGLLAGTLPLIHAHSLFVLFIVTAFLFFFRIDRWREWIAFGIGVSIIAIPALLWIMSGSATNLSEFIAWHFGWDKGDNNFFLFWLKNTGLLIPVVIAGIIVWMIKREDETLPKGKKDKEKPRIPNPTSQILFYIPFVALFVVSNSVKLAPWEWDNIKVLIYWLVGSIPFAAWFLAWLWARHNLLKIASTGLLLVLIGAGALDVFRVISGTIEIRVFDNDAIEIAEKLKLRTPPNALFLNAPTYNSPVVLTGRRSLLRYIGHLSSHGIDYRERENDLKRIYAGDATAEIFIKKYGIEYVLIGPQETGSLSVNEQFFNRFQKIAEAGPYRAYKINKP